MLLLLWCRLATIAPIGPLAWEPLYALGTALKSQKEHKKKKKKENKFALQYLFCDNELDSCNILALQ